MKIFNELLCNFEFSIQDMDGQKLLGCNVWEISVYLLSFSFIDMNLKLKVH